MKENKIKALPDSAVSLSPKKPIYSRSFFSTGQQTQALSLRERVGIATGAVTQTNSATITGYHRQYRSLLPYQYWQLYKTSPDVRACIDSICRRICTWDWNLNVTIDPSDPEYPAISDAAARLKNRLQHPNKSETWQELLTKVVMDLLIYDAAAVEIARDPSGEMQELVAYLGSEFLPIADQHGTLQRYEQHPESYAGGTANVRSGVEFDPEDLVYIKLFNNTRSSLGLPLLETLINECVTVLLASKTAMLALDANEIPSGLLVLGGIAGAAAERATADLKNMKGQDHKIRVITSPQPDAIQAKWLEFKHTPKDLQMTEIVDQLRRAIWRVFGVMPVEVGEMGATPRATALVQVDVSSSHLITPILELLQAKFNRQIMPELLNEELKGKIVFSFDRESRLTPAEKYQVAQRQDLLLKRGVLTINEARHEYGLLPVEGGDVNFVETPLGAIPLKDLQGGQISPQTDFDPVQGVGEAEEEKEQLHALLESKLRDVDYGRKENAAEAMASLPEATQKGLKKKGEEHNEEYGQDAKKKLPDINYLAVSYYRGVGAYITNPSSVRPNVTSADQWAYGRVNGLLYAMRNLKFKRKPYDTDLLSEEHPEYKQDRAVGDQDPTNFPFSGDDKEVSLKNSTFEVFDPEYAEDLKTRYPEIWKAGGNIKGNEQYRILKTVLTNYGYRPETEKQEEAVRLREAWSARHFKDGLQFEDPDHPVSMSTVKGVVALIKWFTVGQIGERRMKQVIDQLKDKIDEKTHGHPQHTCDHTCGHTHSTEDQSVTEWFKTALHSTEDIEARRSDLIPSAWQKKGKFSGYRTIDLSALSDNVMDYSNSAFTVYRDTARSVTAMIRAKVNKSGGISVEDGIALQRKVDTALNDMSDLWLLSVREQFDQAVKVGLKSAEKYVDGTGPISEGLAQRFFTTEASYLTSRRGLVGTLKNRLNTLISNAMRTEATRARAEEEITAASSAAQVSDRVEAVFATEAHRVPAYAGAMVEISNSALTEALEGSVIVDPLSGERKPANWWAEWVSVNDRNTCPACIQFAAMGVQPKKNFRTEPAGDTFCGRNCRCVLVLWLEEEVKNGSVVKFND